MIIGFFGKGGSGKTTTSTRFLQIIGPEYSDVLAVDADHNMDLSYNLGVENPAEYVGTPKQTPHGVRLLAAGPHTEEVFRGEVCSHYLFRPLKEHLKNRSTQDGLVVVDNTAGMDSVGAGIPACLDVAVVCVEPTLHSMKVGRQVIEGLQRETIPVIVVANKISTREQEETVRSAFGDLPIIRIPFHPTADAQAPLSAESIASFRDLHALAKNATAN